MKIKLEGNKGVTAELAEQTPATFCMYICWQKKGYLQTKINDVMYIEDGFLSLPLVV